MSAAQPKQDSSPIRFVNRTFLQGLATILPIALTAYVLWWMGTTAESWCGGLLRRVLPESLYVPGMGVVVGVAVIFAIGLVMRGWLTRRIVRLGEKLIQRLPLVKTIYGAVKDMMSLFATGSEKERLNKVVMVGIGDTNMQMLGFLTREKAHELTGRDEDEGSVAVYLPMSYQIGGFLVVVPEESVHPLDMKVDEALRLAVTAGVSADDTER